MHPPRLGPKLAPNTYLTDLIGTLLGPKVGKPNKFEVLGGTPLIWSKTPKLSKKGVYFGPIFDEFPEFRPPEIVKKVTISTPPRNRQNLTNFEKIDIFDDFLSPLN
jgi:hypothetical protein